MKYILIFLLFLTSSQSVLSQESEFNFSAKGFTDYVVVECEKKTQSELYKKTLDWIAVTYNSPNAVLKSQIENEYIRIEGSATKLIGTGTKYQIEISFKEGKYKFDIIDIQFWNEAENILFGYNEPYWKKFDIINTGKYFDKQGQIKNRYKDEWTRLTIYFNDLNLSLKNFVLSNQIPSKAKDW
ncbi:MAG: DUF4468 domain-containing protein [Chitinophagaceae bacterium]|nr:DUF4468 domain-containing protein [Chitinophagaceae bacterium]